MGEKGEGKRRRGEGRRGGEGRGGEALAVEPSHFSTGSDATVFVKLSWKYFTHPI